ncbi:hypothetical protein [Streptomyces sp. NPDC088400]|uniref:hypothetical protein n=1 Tax=Streptomyces sp. NPDC088400 TaxID=3365861 RepID=UPI003813B284
MTGVVHHASAIGEGPVNGATVRFVLGSIRTNSPDFALRWLREQARRIADGLDPEPWTAHQLQEPVVHRLPAGLRDVPTELRQWCVDADAQEAAWGRLVRGAPVTVTVSDHTGYYALTVRPVPVPAFVPVPAAAAPARLGRSLPGLPAARIGRAVRRW